MVPGLKSSHCSEGNPQRPWGGTPGMVLVVDAGVWGGVHLAGGVYFDHDISAQNEIPNVKKL